MVELIGVHGANHADVVDDRGEARHELANPLAALTMLFVVENRSHHLGRTLDEGEAFALEVFLGTILAVKLCQSWFVLEKFELGWGTRHMEVNDRLGLGGNAKTSFFCGVTIASQQLLQGDGPESHAGLSEKVTAGRGPHFLHIDRKVHGSGFHEGFIQIEQHAGKSDHRRVTLLEIGGGKQCRLVGNFRF